MGEQALYTMNGGVIHRHSSSLFCLHSQLYPTKGLPYNIIHRLVGTLFSQNHDMIVLVTVHKHNTNIQELRILPFLAWWIQMCMSTSYHSTEYCGALYTIMIATQRSPVC